MARRGPVWHGRAFDGGALPLRLVDRLRAFERVVQRCVTELLDERGGDEPRRPIHLAIVKLDPGSCIPWFAAEAGADNNLIVEPPLVAAGVERAMNYLGLATEGSFADVPDDVLRTMMELVPRRKASDMYLTTRPGEDLPRFDQARVEQIHVYLKKPLVPVEYVGVGSVTGRWDAREGRRAQIDEFLGRRLEFPLPSLEVARRVAEADTPDPGARPLVRFRCLSQARDGRVVKHGEILAVTPIPGPELPRRLAELATLPEDWDGDGALAPGADAVRECGETLRDALIAGLATTPLVVPGASGEVWAEWLRSTTPMDRVAACFRGDGGAWVSRSDGRAVWASTGAELLGLVQA